MKENVLLIFIPLLLFSILPLARAAVIAYASADGSGAACSTISPCSIYTAVSLFNDSSSNQGVLVLTSGHYYLNTSVIFPFQSGSISVGGNDDVILECTGGVEPIVALQFSLDAPYTGSIYIQDITFIGCDKGIDFATALPNDTATDTNSLFPMPTGDGGCSCNGNLYVDDCIFTRCSVAIQSVTDSNVYITECTFQNSSVVLNPNATVPPEVDLEDSSFTGCGSGASILNDEEDPFMLLITNADVTLINNAFDGIQYSGAVNLNSCTVNIAGCTFQNTSTAIGTGAAVRLINGLGTQIRDSNFLGNYAASGGVVDMTGLTVGGVSKYNFLIFRSTFVYNTGRNWAVGISSYIKINVSDSTFYNNTSGHGDIMVLNSSTVAISGVSLSGNTADGAVLYSASNSLDISNSTFSDNAGRGITQVGGNVSISQSNFFNNTSPDVGGAIYYAYGPPTINASFALFSSEFFGNYPNDVSVDNVGNVFISVIGSSFNGNVTEIAPIQISGTPNFEACMQNQGANFTGNITGYSWNSYACFLTPDAYIQCGTYLIDTKIPLAQCQTIMPTTTGGTTANTTSGVTTGGQSTSDMTTGPTMTTIASTTTGGGGGDDKEKLALYILPPLAFLIAAFIGAAKLFQHFSGRPPADDLALGEVPMGPTPPAPNSLEAITSGSGAVSGSGAASGTSLAAAAAGPSAVGASTGLGSSTSSATAAAAGPNARRRFSMMFGVTIGATIGKGAFGQVYEGTWNGVKVALKSIPNENATILLAEASVLKSLRHPNIVQFIGLYEAEGHHYMVTEFVEGGSLEFLLHWQPGFFTYRDVVRLARDAAAGMLLLEQKGIIHRDLAARNLLVDVTRQDLTLKVADFGMARVNSVYTARRDTPFPVKWSSPEVLLYHRYSSKSDVWSLGMVLWEMLSYGKTPYVGMSNKEASDFVLKGNRLAIPPKTPPPLESLIKRCWATNPEDRPMFMDIFLALQKLLDAPQEYDLPDIDSEATYDLPAPSPVLQEFVSRRVNSTSQSSNSKSPDGPTPNPRSPAPTPPITSPPPNPSRAALPPPSPAQTPTLTSTNAAKSPAPPILLAPPPPAPTQPPQPAPSDSLVELAAALARIMPVDPSIAPPPILPPPPSQPPPSKGDEKPVTTELAKSLEPTKPSEPPDPFNAKPPPRSAITPPLIPLARPAPSRLSRSTHSIRQMLPSVFSRPPSTHSHSSSSSHHSSSSHYEKIPTPTASSPSPSSYETNIPPLDMDIPPLSRKTSKEKLRKGKEGEGKEAEEEEKKEGDQPESPLRNFVLRLSTQLNPGTPGRNADYEIITTNEDET